jgi:D-3-phosphoglycerate dehydrogenase
MTRLRALCPEPQNYSARGLEAFGRLFDVHALRMSQAEFEQNAPAYDVLLVRLQARVPGDLVSRCPRLKLIVSPTTGVDHIDLGAAAAAGIAVLTLQGETEVLRTIASTAEHTWALLLALVRRLEPALDHVRGGEWLQHPFRGRELRGKTLGVVGLGRLGTMVARYGAAFDMRVIANDPGTIAPPAFVDRMLPLAQLLAESDVVSVHVPLTMETRDLIDRNAIASMKPGAILINTARGAIVDENALLDALRDGRLAGAAVDVLSDESAAGRKASAVLDYCRRHDHLLVTPHIGGASEEAIERTDSLLAERAASWLPGHAQVTSAPAR